MIYALVGGLAVTAGLLVWLSSLLGVAGLIIALILALGGLIAFAVVYWMRNQEEHLYEELPRLTSIRKPLTPAYYPVRSNMDPPFFSFESQNYGKPKPRTRVKNVPIDRYLELQEQIDTLTQAIAALSEQLSNTKAEIAVLDSEGKTVETTTLVVRDPSPEPQEPVGVVEAPKPRVDSTLSKSESRNWFRKPPELPVMPDVTHDGPYESSDAEPQRRGPRPPSYVMEILANTQQGLSKLWRRS